jgi:hypothetical protein
MTLARQQGTLAAEVASGRLGLDPKWDVPVYRSGAGSGGDLRRGEGGDVVVGMVQEVELRA